MRILHLFTDWHLCNMAADIFRHQPDDSKFIVIRQWQNVGKKHEYLKEKYNVEDIGRGTARHHELMRQHWDVVWVHGLYPEKAIVVNEMDSRVKVVWTTWGIDYLFFGPIWLFGFRTTFKWARCFFTCFRIFKQKILYWLVCHLHLYWIMRYNPLVKPHHRELARFLHRVDYFSTSVEDEEPLVRKIIGMHAKWIPFHCIEYKPPPKVSDRANLDSKRILLGNSATITNNHYDVIPMLTDSPEYEVYAPLSYTLEGVKIDDYTLDVIAYGKKWLGERFHPMTGFLPYEEYLRAVMPSSVYVFGHRRPQALGNISIALNRGGCVFLNPVNPIYKYYTRNGIIIYPLSRLKEGISHVVEEFRPYQKQNMDRFRKLRSHEKLLAEMFASINLIRQDVIRDRAAQPSSGQTNMFFTYRIVFDANGGSGEMSRATMTYGMTGKLPLNAFAKSGMEFAGWSYEPKGKVMWVDGGEIVTPPVKDGKCRLYAIWREPTYLNVFDANGGVGHMDSVRRTVMQRDKLPKNKFVREGYTFSGWSYKPNGASVWFDEGVIENPPIKDGKSILYAVWVPKRYKYKLTFDANGGKGRMDCVVKTFGEKSRLPLNDFVKDGYEFVGWSYDPTKNVVWADGEDIITPPVKDGNCRLYAIWEKV